MTWQIRNQRRWLGQWVWIAILGLFPAATNAGAARIPVVLDTDIGTDIDDSWALTQLLRSPELDLKLVLTSTGDTRYRAAIAAKFLERAGRTDVPVGVGVNQKMPEGTRNLEPWITGYDLAKYRGTVHADGVAALIDLIMHSTETITIIAVGPVPNLAEALKREPAIASRCRLVGMHGSFDRGYGNSPQPAAEYNVKDQIGAFRAVFSAPWRDVLITPLDTCGVVEIGGEDYHRIWCSTGDPTLRALIESYCVFAPRVQWMTCDFFPVKSTTLFDCVAVYLAHAENWVEIETLNYEVTDDGFTRRSATGPMKARVALRWKNFKAFEDQLVKRLLTP